MFAGPTIRGDDMMKIYIKKENTLNNNNQKKEIKIAPSELCAVCGLYQRCIYGCIEYCLPLENKLFKSASAIIP